MGGPAPFWEVCAAASEIEVDEATGSIRMLRHVVASDVGRAINPAATAGQDLGAAVMGLGQTLTEELRYDERGRLINADLEGYRIPAAEDVAPEVESILIENGDGPGPFGAKGVGESGIMAVSASVGNALHDATGARVRRLPLSPERVWRALNQLRHGETTMNLSHQEHQAATAIDDARSARATLDRADHELSLEDGYRIQAARGRGRTQVGYKLGLVSRAKQEQVDISSPLTGRVYDDMLSRELEIDLSRHIRPRIEPEVAVVLARDVAAGTTAKAAGEAVGTTRLAVDLLDTVWDGYRFAPGQIVADNLAEGAVFIGDAISPTPDGVLTLVLDGEVVAQGPIAALGDPGERLRWLAGLVGRAARRRRRVPRLTRRRRRRRPRAHRGARAGRLPLHGERAVRALRGAVLSPPALIVVDVQRAFDDPSWGPRNNPDCDRNIAALIEHWRERGDPLVYVRHDSDEPGSTLAPDSPGNAFKDIVTGEPDLLVTKSVNSSFHGEPSLQAWLDGEGIGTIYVCGITTNHCCETTARVGGNLGFDVRFVIDATHTFDRPDPYGGVVTADELARVTATNLHEEFATVIDTETALADKPAPG